MNEAYKERLGDFLDEENYEYRDVLVADRKHTAVLFEDQWVLLPVIYKFGGQPFLEIKECRLIEEDELGRLEGWK